VPGEKPAGGAGRGRARPRRYLGQLAIYPLENLDEALDLRKDWKLFDDNRHFRTVAVPLEAAGRHLETDVALPAEWQGKDVYLEFEVADRWSAWS